MEKEEQKGGGVECVSILGVDLSPPVAKSWATAAVLCVASFLIAAFVLRTISGGSWANVAGFSLAGACAGLVSACGASHEQAGGRGIVLTVLVALLAYPVGFFLFVLGAGLL